MGQSQAGIRRHLDHVHTDTVRSTTLQEYESSGMDSLSLDKTIRELLACKKIELSK